MQQDEGDIHKPVRLVVVDDHWVFRQGICAVLESFRQQVHVVGEAASADDALFEIEQRSPDVVLLDLRLPLRLGELARPSLEHGLGAISRIAQLARSPRVLVLTYLDEPQVLFDALRAGAHGYITKGDPYESGMLVDAIVRTHAGEVFYGPSVAQLIRDYHLQQVRNSHTSQDRLTPREQEVLDLLADRKSNSEIASQLVISVKTVKTHVANILDKLHLESRHEVPVYVRLNPRDRQD